MVCGLRISRRRGLPGPPRRRRHIFDDDDLVGTRPDRRQLLVDTDITPHDASDISPTSQSELAALRAMLTSSLNSSEAVSTEKNTTTINPISLIPSFHYSVLLLLTPITFLLVILYILRCVEK